MLNFHRAIQQNRPSLLMILLISMNTLLASQESPPAKQNIAITRVSSPIKIDGRVNEPAWTEAARFEIKYEWFPGDNISPPVRTECFVAYNDNHFFVAVKCQDPNPQQIRAHIRDRDAIQSFVQDDHIVILLDTFNDQRRAFQFRVNPLGVQADAAFSASEGFEDFSWDAIWNSAGRITEDGYEIEIAIPFSQLRFPKTDKPQTWGFDVGRSYPRNMRHRMAWMYTDRNNNCLLCQMNKISGIQGITPGRNIELSPTVTANRSDARTDFPVGSVENGDPDGEFGFTGKWGITPNLILNATANPDFSQVEADAAQLDVNTRFALFLPEKRPFFLEGADLFTTPLRAVFTRTVVDPQGGLKLSGKQGDNAVGVFLTRDRINNLIFPSNQGSRSASLDQDVNTGVLRFRRDVGGASTVGVLLSERNGENYHNRVGSVDGFVRFSRTNTMRFQLLGSNTEYAPAIADSFKQKQGEFRSLGGQIRLQHGSRKWVGNVTYRDLGRDFRADAGFIPRVDVRQLSGALQRRFRSRGDAWYSQINTGFFASRTSDHNGLLTDQALSFNTFLLGPLQSVFVANFYAEKELFQEIEYDLQSAEFLVSLKPSGRFDFSVRTQFGEAVDFRNAQKADELVVASNLGLKMGRRLRVTANHTLQRLSAGGASVLDFNQVQSTIHYNFTLRAFARLITQYRLIDFGGSEEISSLFNQLLFSYKINPQTVAFFGYSGNASSGNNYDLTLQNRTFFAKIGYAFLL